MSLSHLKQLFLVGILGLSLIGCSSGPAVEDASGAAAQKVATDSTVTTSDADQAAAKAASDAAAAKAASDAAAEKAASDAAAKAAKAKTDALFAQLQGKVVNFDFDRSEIKPAFREIIKLNADYLSSDTSATVTIKGYCDERGTPEYNLALGERRANSVKNALVAEGVSPSRISVISFGEEDPVDPAHNEAAWAKNRRATFSY